MGKEFPLKSYLEALASRAALSHGHTSMAFDAMLDGLRDHPRFQKVLADMKFPP